MSKIENSCGFYVSGGCHETPVYTRAHIRTFSTLIFVIVLSLLAGRVPGAHAQDETPPVDMTATPTPTLTELPPLVESFAAAAEAQSAATACLDLTIANSAGGKGRPVMAYNPDRAEYLVVWEHYGDTPQTIHGRIMTAAGETPGAEFALPNPRTRIQYRPRAAYDSATGRYAVTWAEYDSTYHELHFQLLSATGEAEGNDILITNTLRHINGSDMIYDSANGEYLVMWSDDSAGERPYARRVSGNRQLLGTAPLMISTSAFGGMRLVYNPDGDQSVGQYLAVWGVAVSGYGVEVRAQRLRRAATSSGLTPVGTAIPVTVNRAGDQGWWVSATYNPTAKEYLVVWEDSINQSTTGDDIFGQRLNSITGERIDGPIPIAVKSGLQSEPDVAYDALLKKYLVIWGDQAVGHVAGQYFDDVVQPEAGDGLVFLRSGSGGGQYLPRNIADYGSFLVVWSYSNEIRGSICPQKLPPTVTVSITDAQGNAVNTLVLNDDGWPAPNPLTGKMTVLCPVGGPDGRSDLSLAIGFAGGAGRFHLYAVSYDNPSSYNWQLWIQPSDAATLNVSTAYGSSSKSAQVSIPRAAIHPIVFLPGLGATMPPAYSGNTDQLLALGEAAHYSDLYDTLEKMGYEMNKTLFLFPYDWLRSHITSARYLRDRLETASDIAETVPWVAGYPESDDINFDLIGHSTGNIIARTYIQLDQGFDSGTGTCGAG